VARGRHTACACYERLRRRLAPISRHNRHIWPDRQTGLGDLRILVLNGAQIDKEYWWSPRGEAMRAFVGTTSFPPSLAEFTVVEPD
jgi:hypothetical protein